MTVSPALSDKVIGRLSLYRRILERPDAQGRLLGSVFSHQLGAMTGGTAALVRRDLMMIGFSGNPKKGYDVADLVRSIGDFLDAPEGLNAILVGVGNLGRALLSHFTYRRPKLPIVAAFDSKPELVHRVIQGCRCHPVEEMERVIREQAVRVGIIAVPTGSAQSVADVMVRSGVCGLLNFAPIALRVPQQVYVDNIDMTMSLEKAAFFARQHAKEKEVAK